MKTALEILDIARQTIRDETRAIIGLEAALDENFVRVVESILHSKGRVIITGIGKSALIGSKIVSTLNSTGTPAIFMHAADAIHGDLGMIQPEDLVVCISKSGNTAEIKVLIPLLKTMGNKLIALVGNTASYLATHADFVLNASVDREACTNNLAPTSSTTAQLVMGDALAIALLESRGFTAQDFAKYHPGGALGKQLYLKVEDLAIMNDKPMVQKGDNLRTVILEISSRRLGCAVVMENTSIVGIITDGDLRRMLEKNIPLDAVKASDIMNVNPKTIEKGTLAVQALEMMRAFNITQLLVTENENLLGLLHLHDILREGII